MTNSTPTVRRLPRQPPGRRQRGGCPGRLPVRIRHGRDLFRPAADNAACAPDATGQQVVTSSIRVGCMIGALGASALSERLARRPIGVVVGIVFARAALATVLFPNPNGLLIAARGGVGLAGGASSQILPLTWRSWQGAESVDGWSWCSS